MKLTVTTTRVASTPLDERWEIRVEHDGGAHLTRTVTIRAGLTPAMVDEQLAGAAGEAIRLMRGSLR